MLVCLAYPELKPDDAEVIANHRGLHDRTDCDMVEAHWTLVFPTLDVSVDDMERQLLQVARRTRPIDFTVRYSMVHDDDFNSDFYVVLVPDEGFSSICRLHDDLYSDFMAPHRRVDLPYVPHIGIATNKDPNHLKRLADEWNTFTRTIHEGPSEGEEIALLRRRNPTPAREAYPMRYVDLAGVGFRLCRRAIDQPQPDLHE